MALLCSAVFQCSLLHSIVSFPTMKTLFGMLVSRLGTCQSVTLILAAKRRPWDERKCCLAQCYEIIPKERGCKLNFGTSDLLAALLTGPTNSASAWRKREVSQPG
jgi:hypothetical protein